ncbi:MAG: hypothetical protein WAM91_05020, partial [Candidatus Acidiferrales bacterium]
LLVARVKITTYNHHCSAPFFRALVVYSYQVYSEGGADNVIQSAREDEVRAAFLQGGEMAGRGVVGVAR